jgi:hypothetical protein
VELDTLGGMVAVRCPLELVPPMTWHPASRRWLDRAAVD